MSKLIHIVTGATGGLGKAIVEGLVERKTENIVLACRNGSKAQEIIAKYKESASNLRFIPLDLMSFKSVRQFAQIIKNEELRVDTLFNNAGAMPGKLIVSPDGYEAATQTNFLSTALLTGLLLERMQPGSHIIFTTSVARYIVRLHNNWQERSVKHQSRFITYGRSKLMLTHWGASLAKEVAPCGIIVNFADPGAASTSMITMGNRIIDFLADKLVRPIISTPSQGAEPALMASVATLPGYIFSRRLGHTSVSPLPKRYFKPIGLLSVL